MLKRGRQYGIEVRQEYKRRISFSSIFDILGSAGP